MPMGISSRLVDVDIHSRPHATSQNAILVTIHQIVVGSYPPWRQTGLQ